MKKWIIGGVILLVVFISVANAISYNTQSSNKPQSAASNTAIASTKPSNTVTNTITSTVAPTYLTFDETVKGLDTFIKFNKLDLGDSIAWEGENNDTGTRVRVITDKDKQDKVTTIYVWAQASNTDEATNRTSFSILKTVTANTAPDSISWLENAYATVLKDPTQNEEKTFGNKTITVNYADIKNQLTFREDVNE